MGVQRKTSELRETIKLTEQQLPGRHQVVEVDELDERLHLGSLLSLLLAHGTGDLLGVSVNAGDWS